MGSGPAKWKEDVTSIVRHTTGLTEAQQKLMEDRSPNIQEYHGLTLGSLTLEYIGIYTITSIIAIMTMIIMIMSIVIIVVIVIIDVFKDILSHVEAFDGFRRRTRRTPPRRAWRHYIDLLAAKSAIIIVLK